MNILSRYGLRGIRIGEASHPGPPMSQLRRAQTVPTEADSSIPTVMDLTAMDRESEGNSVDDDGDSEFAEHHDVLRDAEPVVNPIPRGRRLVLVGGGQSPHSPARTEQDSDHSFAEDFGEEDTESLPGSVSQGEDPVDELLEFVARRREINAAFQNLDVWNQEEIFQSRAHVMKTVPSFLRGGFRAALRIALDEAIAGWAHRDVTQQERRFRGRNWRIVFKRSSLASGSCSSKIPLQCQTQPRRHASAKEDGALQTTKVPGRRGWP